MPFNMRETSMDKHNHSLACLFEQLGLDSTDQAIQDFINQNAALPGNIELHRADFCSSSQSSFFTAIKGLMQIGLK